MRNILLIVLLSVFGFAAKSQYNTFSCVFPTYATEKGTFNDNVIRFTLVTYDAKGRFIRKGSKGEYRGNIIKGDQGLSFVEVSKVGNVTTTTMTKVPPLEEEQKAVYSRNILSKGKLLANQYYGTCHLVDKVLTKKVSFPISKSRRLKIIKKLKVEKEIKKLPPKDVKYVMDALEGIFPSRQEMEQDMSIEGMILVGRIMDDAMKKK
jgi:hypothetical protein